MSGSRRAGDPSRPVDAAARQPLGPLWERHDRDWRHPAQAITRWTEAGCVDRRLLAARPRGDWWGLLESLDCALLVTREYEHLVLCLRASQSGPRITHFPLPHPSGLVIDRSRALAYIASTRNPTQVYEFGLGAPGMRPAEPDTPTLLPLRSRFLPGRLYVHDLALIDGVLYANAVGENAVVALPPSGGYVRAWWPRSIEHVDGLAIDRNYLQLNSIAAGPTLEQSFFSASTDRPAARRPGHLNFVPDGRGVVFSGQTREPVAWGLTRPHSARLLGPDVWVNNSGYGELGRIGDGRFHALTQLPGWTRGLAFCGDVVFVGTSRVIPRFRHYAPGLDVARSECAVHAVDWRSGRILASLVWPGGNQIFAIDWLPSTATSGLPFHANDGATSRRARHLFFTYGTR